MKILITPHNWFHPDPHAGIAGGEIYLSRLCEFLQSKGHEIKAITGGKEPYTYNNIPSVFSGNGIEMWQTNNDIVAWCDVIICQLLGSPFGYNRAYQHKKPLIFIAHNNSKSYPVMHCKQEDLSVVYNSYQLRDDLFKTLGHFNGIVLHPIMPKLKRATKGKYITMINCNLNKGGLQFVELARQLPQYEFLGIEGGYGEQIKEDLPNLTYLPNGSDMAKVYADTKILLVLSEFESFSQVAMEAMLCGIPVLAHPTQGLLENLSGAGIFIKRDDIEKYKQTIVYLIEDKSSYQKQSDILFERGEILRDKSLDELEKFNTWLNKIPK